MVSNTVQECVRNQTSFFRLQFGSIHNAFSKNTHLRGSHCNNPKVFLNAGHLSHCKSFMYYKELETRTSPALPGAAHTAIQLPVTHLSTAAESALSLQQNKAEKHSVSQGSKRTVGLRSTADTSSDCCYRVLDFASAAAASHGSLAASGFRGSSS